VAHVERRRTANGQVRWDVRYRAPDAKERSRTFRTRKEAERFEASVRVTLDDSTWIDPRAGKLKLRTYAGEWLATRPALKPRTRQTYTDQLRIHVYPTLGDKELKQVTPQDVRLWHAGLSAAGLSANTAAKCYRLLRTIMSTAVSDELIARNPCQIRGASIERASERPTISAAQVWELADAVGTRYRCAVLLAGFMGLRVGELLGLERRHVDLHGAWLHIQQQEQELRQGERIVTTPKSLAGRRSLSIPTFLIDELEDHMRDYVHDEPAARIFVGEKGGTLRRHVLHKKWDSARVEVGLPEGFRFHDLRHTANTLTAMTGASTRELMHRMGHASSDAALRYQHATTARDVELAAALGDLIAKDRPTQR
jgi:integrase